MSGRPNDGEQGFGPRLPAAVNAHDRWSVSASLVAHSAGLAVVECVISNQVYGNMPALRLTLAWRPGMEQRDVEARALVVAGQSLGYLRQAMLDEAVAKVA